MPRKVSPLTEELMTFDEFWPRYLHAHANPRTRAIHVAGTLAATALAAIGIARGRPGLVGAALVAGYAPAWFSHAFIERNRPETFRAPMASLRADFIMAWHVLRGTIDEEYARHG